MGIFLVWILRTNHMIFPYRQCGLAGVMLLRIPSSQNFFWKMASPSWVSLSDILFLSFWFSLSVLPVFHSVFCFSSVWHALCSYFLSVSNSQSNPLHFFFFFFSSLFLTSYLSFFILIVCSVPRSFPWDTEKALISKTLAF